MRTISAIQADIDSTEAAIKAGGVDQSQVDVWNMQIADFKIEMKAVEEAQQQDAQAQQERVQAQTEKVESITLPLDFNDLLDNPLANEMIIEVIKQFQLQAYNEHNADIDQMNAIFKQRLDELTNEWDAARTQLYTVNADLQNKLDQEESARGTFARLSDSEKERADQYEHDLYQSDLEKKEAESKRDNAVKELEQAKAEIDRLNSHVFELQQQIASAPAPRAAIDITPNDRLTDLAKQAKESTIEKANRGLARWNLPAIEVPSMPAAEIPTLESQFLADPPIPAAQEEHPKDAENTPTHTEGDPSTTGNQPVEQMVAKAAEETTITYATKEEHEALAARVATIERHANIQAVA